MGTAVAVAMAAFADAVAVAVVVAIIIVIMGMSTTSMATSGVAVSWDKADRGERVGLSHITASLACCAAASVGRSAAQACGAVCGTVACQRLLWAP